MKTVSMPGAVVNNEVGYSALRAIPGCWLGAPWWQ